MKIVIEAGTNRSVRVTRDNTINIKDTEINILRIIAIKTMMLKTIRSTNKRTNLIKKIQQTKNKKEQTLMKKMNRKNKSPKKYLINNRYFQIMRRNQIPLKMKKKLKNQKIYSIF